MDAALGTSGDVFPSKDQRIEIAFLVEGDLDLEGKISYRGKFGPATGWVISEDTGPAIPEPSAALVFGAGLLVLRSRLRSPRRV